MHDLLRHYARDLAVRLDDDSQSALERLADFYIHCPVADCRFGG
jgi:hypothetical protein